MTDASRTDHDLAPADTPLDDLPAFDRLAELRRVFAAYWRAGTLAPRRRFEPAPFDS